MKIILALFDLIAGILLDKEMLAKGVRVGSMRRVILAAAASIVFIHLYGTDIWAWVEIVALAIVIFGLDLQGAIAAAPTAALNMIGGVIGRVAGGIKSAYGSTRGAFSDREREDLP